MSLGPMGRSADHAPLALLFANAVTYVRQISRRSGERGDPVTLPGRRTNLDSGIRSTSPGGTARPGPHGFTLIEIVVGLTVGGIVLMMGFAALASVQDRSAHAAEVTAAALEGATSRAAIIDWLAAARPRATELDGSFIGFDAREHGMPTDLLMFPTRARTPMRVPVTLVRLYIDTAPETLQRGLVADFVAAIGQTPQLLELAPQATGLLIRYLPVSDLPVDWIESWVGQNPPLPRMVEIQLTDNPSDPLPPLLRMPIRVPLATVQ
jgi:prepilin-type N-terminal cleavage/methylation domain-containing protein